MANKKVQGKHYGSPFAANLRLLIDRQAEGKVKPWADRVGINQTTVNRIYNGSMDPTLSMILGFSDKTGFAAWQLLHPEFDPRTMPPLGDARTMRVAAIFGSITNPVDKDRAESIMEQFAPDGSTQHEAQPIGLPHRSQ